MGKNYCKVEHKWCKFCKHQKCFLEKKEGVLLKTVKKCSKRLAVETIPLRAIFQRVSFEDVFSCLIGIWSDQIKNKDAYEKVFNECVTMRGWRNDMFIECQRATYSDGSCICVSGKRLNEKWWSSIEMMRWEYWIVMNLTQKTLDEFTDEEIVAACLYEMTWHGFTQDKIQKFGESLIKDFEEMKNENS